MKLIICVSNHFKNHFLITSKLTFNLIIIIQELLSGLINIFGVFKILLISIINTTLSNPIISFHFDSNFIIICFIKFPNYLSLIALVVVKIKSILNLEIILRDRIT
jgi:hypothetical protein